jgi:hypothetical protein
MASKAVRRRPADKGSDKLMETTTTPDSVTEPLLGNTAQGSKSEVSYNVPLSSLNLGFLAFCDLLMSSHVLHYVLEFGVINNVRPCFL